MARDKKRKQEKKKRSKTSKLVLCCMIIFSGVVASNFFMQVNTYQDLKAQEEQLKQEIEEEKQKTIELETQREYYNSEAYVEKVAREQLGLIKPDEVLYINRADS